jgi:hypothetical protein
VREWDDLVAPAATQPAEQEKLEGPLAAVVQRIFAPANLGHGNWFGPDHTGDLYRDESGELVASPPVDIADAIAMLHDARPNDNLTAMGGALLYLAPSFRPVLAAVADEAKIAEMEAFARDVYTLASHYKLQLFAPAPRTRSVGTYNPALLPDFLREIAEGRQMPVLVDEATGEAVTPAVKPELTMARDLPADLPPSVTPTAVAPPWEDSYSQFMTVKDTGFTGASLLLPASYFEKMPPDLPSKQVVVDVPLTASQEVALYLVEYSGRLLTVLFSGDRFLLHSERTSSDNIATWDLRSFSAPSEERARSWFSTGSATSSEEQGTRLAAMRVREFKPHSSDGDDPLGAQYSTKDGRYSKFDVLQDRRAFTAADARKPGTGKPPAETVADYHAVLNVDDFSEIAYDASTTIQASAGYGIISVPGGANPAVSQFNAVATINFSPFMCYSTNGANLAAAIRLCQHSARTTIRTGPVQSTTGRIFSINPQVSEALTAYTAATSLRVSTQKPGVASGTMNGYLFDTLVILRDVASAPQLTYSMEVPAYLLAHWTHVVSSIYVMSFSTHDSSWGNNVSTSSVGRMIEGNRFANTSGNFKINGWAPSTAINANWINTAAALGGSLMLASPEPASLQPRRLPTTMQF